MLALSDMVENGEYHLVHISKVQSGLMNARYQLVAHELLHPRAGKWKSFVNHFLMYISVFLQKGWAGWGVEPISIQKYSKKSRNLGYGNPGIGEPHHPVDHPIIESPKLDPASPLPQKKNNPPKECGELWRRP